MKVSRVDATVPLRNEYGKRPLPIPSFAHFCARPVCDFVCEDVFLLGKDNHFTVSFAYTDRPSDPILIVA